MNPLRVYEFNNTEWVFHKMLEEKKAYGHCFG